jgi:hypothetical protein
MQSSTLDQGKLTSNFLDKRYDVLSIVIQLMNNRRRTIPRGHAEHPNTKESTPKEWGRRRSWKGWTYHTKIKCTTQADLEGKGGIIIRVTITRGATIKVSISGTNSCTRRMIKTGEVLFGGLKTSSGGKIGSYPYLLSRIA